MSPARLHVHLFGPFRLLRDDHSIAGFEPARLRDLLSYLILFRTTPVSRQQLAFTLWPDTSDRQALKNLRTLLTRLRQALPDADEFIHVTPQTLQWRSEAHFDLDVTEFETALARAAQAQTDGDSATATSELTAAVAAYTGDLLPECYDDWILPLRARLRLAYSDALERLVLSLEEQRDYGQALSYAQRLLQVDPLHEATYRYLMRLHLAQGNRTEALRTYQACQAMLQREFATAPTRTTRDLYETLLRGDDVPHSASTGQPLIGQPVALPLIGREAEWSFLLATWRAAAAGRPQMILLTGEAGIGKTRLAEELVAWVARHGLATAAAHCYPEVSGGVLAYAPVAEWLRSAALQPRLAALEDTWLVEVARLQPALLNKRPHLAPPGPLTEPWQRTRLFEALAHAVIGTVRDDTNPLLLFVDDLHWADRETLDWLVYLLRFDPSAPVLVVSTVRGHDMSRDHPLTLAGLALARAGLLREIVLSRLDANDTTRLAASVAGRAIEPHEAAEIYHDTEGNPLFVVEMVRARAGGKETNRQIGKEAREPLEVGLAAMVAAPALSPKVRAVIQSRLALLSPGAQALAQTAAVIGREFSLDVLVRSSGQDRATVLQNLDELWQRQLVRVQSGASYDFSHEGIRSVAYDSIGPIRRGTLHLHVAQALEEIHHGDIDATSGQIAAHYARAGESQLAITFYRRAAAAAQRIYANAEAVRLYRHLLESDLNTSLSVPERISVMLALGEVWQATGYWVKAQVVDQQALDAAERLGDVRLQAQAQQALAGVMHLQGYYDEALERLARAEQGFKSIGEWRGVVSTLGTAGQIYWFRGDHPRAQAILEQQHQIAAEIGDTHGMCEALEALGMVQFSQGDWAQSTASCLQAITMAETLAYKPVITRAAITLGNVRLAQSAAGEAVQWFVRAGKLAQQIDDRRTLSWAISNIAMVLAQRGDYQRAMAGYEHSLRYAWEIGDRWTACRIVAALATVNERLEWTERAEQLYRKAIDLELWLGTPGFLSGILVSLARLLLEQGRAAEAHAFYRQAAEMLAHMSSGHLAGEDTGFDLRVLGIRVRHALGELTTAEAAAALRTLLTNRAAPVQQAALQYELWRLTQDETTRENAAVRCRALYHATGVEDYRMRYRELTGKTLPAPEPLPDVATLIPILPGDHMGEDLEKLLGDLTITFD